MAALVAAGIAVYLSAVRLLGGAPVCGPDRACETVQGSEYAVLLGLVPVAYLGLAFALAVVVLAARWWRRADRWALVAAYGLLLVGAVFCGWLTYLELAVIKAICPWCVGFAVSVVAGLVIALVALVRTSRPAGPGGPA